MAEFTEVLGQAKFIQDLSDQATAQEPPSTTSDGVAIPDGRGNVLKTQVAVYSAADSGTRSHHVRVFGLIEDAETAAGAAVTVDKWFMLEDLTEKTDTDVRQTAGDFGVCYQINVGRVFNRVATKLAALPGGTNPVVDTFIGFS